MQWHTKQSRLIRATLQKGGALLITPKLEVTESHTEAWPPSPPLQRRGEERRGEERRGEGGLVWQLQTGARGRKVGLVSLWIGVIMMSHVCDRSSDASVCEEEEDEVVSVTTSATAGCCVCDCRSGWCHVEDTKV